MLLDLELDDGVVLAQHLQIDVLGFTRFWVLTNKTRVKKPTLIFNFTFLPIENLQKFTNNRRKMQQFIENRKRNWNFCVCMKMFASKCDFTIFLLYFTTKWRLLTWRGCLRANVKLYNLAYTHCTAHRLFVEWKILDKVHQIIHRFVVNSALGTYFFVISHFWCGFSILFVP